MGLLYGYIFKEYYGGDDTWMYYNESLIDYNKLLFQPGEFFKEWIHFRSFSESDNFSEAFRNFLQNTERNTVIKSLAFFNLVSYQNYYVDVVFFNLFSFGGSYLLFKLFSSIHINKRRIVYLCAFFIPPVAFWLSGIRPDGILLLFIAITLYYFHAWLSEKRTNYFLYVLLGLLGILIFRSQFFILMVPALIAWGLTKRFKFNQWKCIALVYIVAIIVFFSSSLLSSKTNFPSWVVQKQEEFFLLKGTSFHLDTLEPKLGSFMKVLPQAAANSAMRPLPWEAKGPLQLASSVEVIFFWVVFAIAMFYRRNIPRSPIVPFIIFWACSVYLLIGYTVPFPGAIVRYKIIPEFLLFLLFIPAIPFKLRK